MLVTEIEYDRVPKVAEASGRPELSARLRSFWESKPGLYGWLATVDHKTLGIRYIVTAFVFLGLGGIEALIMRIQLAQPNEHVLTPEEYNQLFTMHGITMILWYALPILTGFSVYLQPLLLGCRDMALPRLNAFTYWVFLFSGIFLYTSFLIGAAPDAGWFNYVPLASIEQDPGPNIDFYAMANIFLGISTTLGGVNFIVTILRFRAPGMSINRLPIMSWGTLTISVASVLSIPAVSLAFFLLWMDRHFGTHFFDPATGGQPLLWQHLFWLWGHPWVYIIVLPALSMVSQALPVCCRRPLVGYSLVALATVLTMVLGFGVWLHHMFATGLPTMALAFFSAVSLVIAIPSAVSLFAWLATIWTGRPDFTTAFYFFAGFIIVFVIGGVSGFMTASVPVDWQLTDTYFVVAHIHYVLIGWNLFAVLGALYHWFPKMSGRMLDETLGKISFWFVFIGFNVGFFPMHISGLLGMPRRIYTYSPEMGWSTLNLITSIGSFVLAIGLLITLVNVVRSLRVGRIAGPNPWDADTLEWSTSSPPPPYNFAVIPTVASRSPLWEARLGEPQRSQPERGFVLDHGKETLGTTMLDAVPDVIVKMPEDSLVPLLLSLALAALFTTMMLEAWWWLAASAIAILVITVAWLWPRQSLGEIEGSTP
ncbi:MAG: cytochrome c oxidase subunit I [Proteobacteria bacterium]|nr:cytochrome c oxidase subunit I [Pseudomonadota bacterium]